MLYLVSVVAVAIVWMMAWGSISFANALGGAAVGVLLLTIAPDSTAGLRRWGSPIRPVAILRFVVYVLFQVVKSNGVLSREVLTRHSGINTGVIAVPLPECSDGLMTLITNTMALTPGTMPLQVDRNPTVLYIHLLHLSDIEAARGEARHLAELAYRAFGSDSAIAALADPSFPSDPSSRSGADPSFPSDPDHPEPGRRDPGGTEGGLPDPGHTEPGPTGPTGPGAST